MKRLAGDTFFKTGKYGSGLGDFISGWALPVQFCVLFDLALDFFAGQQHGGVVFIAHESAYF